MIKHHRTSATLVVGGTLSAASLVLYVSTAAPTLTWGYNYIGVDGGELLAAAYTLGIPHPPGYPTYMLLLKLFASVVQVGDFAYRGNLLSAVLGSVSVGLLFAVILRFCQWLRPEGPRSVWITSASLGATIFATSPLFWSQATITEVYTLNTLFIGALLLIASHLVLRLPSERELEEPYITKKLALFGFLLGLGLGNHLTLLAVGVPFLVWLWVALGRQRLMSPWVIGAFFMGLCVYIYLPIRASHTPPINWGDASTLDGFLWMLSGRVYHEYVFGVPLETIPERLLSWASFAFLQFNPLGIFIGLMGSVPLLKKERWFLGTSASSMGILSVYSITYRTVDYQVILISAFMLFAVWTGIGFFWIASSISDWIKDSKDLWALHPLRPFLSRPLLILSISAFGAMPLASTILNYHSQNLRDDHQAYEYANNVMSFLPYGSLVLSREESRVFSLWYMGYVEKTNKDVATIAVPLLQFDWYLSDLHARFPDRVPAYTPADTTKALKILVEHNYSDARVFFTYRSRLLEDLFEMVLVGELFEARPKSIP